VPVVPPRLEWFLSLGWCTNSPLARVRYRCQENVPLRISRQTLLRSVLTATLSGFILGCGNRTSNNLLEAPNAAVAISVSMFPPSSTILVGQTLQLAANVRGTNTTTVTWSVNGVIGGNLALGTITSAGLYSAPRNSFPEILAIRAASTVDPTKFASANVLILAPGEVSPTNNPQVARYSFTSPRDGTAMIEFGADTNYGLHTWSQPIPSGGGTVTILVAGMRAFTTYHMRAVVQFSDNTQFVDGDHLFITGGLPPERVPSVTVTRSSSLASNGGVEVLNLSGSPLQAAVVDLEGNLIWYFDPPYGATRGLNPIKFLSDGNILVNYSQGPSDGAQSILSEIDLAGNAIWQLTASDLSQKLITAGFNWTITGTHHDVLPLPNGHLIVIVGIKRNFTDLPGFPGTTTVLGDGLVDLDPNRDPVWAWSTFDQLDVNRHPMAFPDWTHSNTIVYSPSDGDLILSMRHQNWIIKIAYEDGRGDGHIAWKLGYQGDFALQGGTDPADWFYAQHAPNILTPNSSGIFQIGLFDNGNDRVVDPNGTLCSTAVATSCSSRVSIFELDETAKTAKLLWQDDLPSLSSFGGYMQEFSDNNVEFDEAVSATTSPSATVQEVTHEGTPQTVLQMNINGAYAYRAFRIPSLYPGVQW
jgi:arylsulfate sulfotransferase